VLGRTTMFEDERGRKKTKSDWNEIFTIEEEFDFSSSRRNHILKQWKEEE